MVGIDKFNIRVYGIAIQNHKVLLADEQIGKLSMTKFPGGGLEPGEGLLEGLYREFREELGTEPLKSEHFYTTDFFVSSAFRPNEQIISVYYRVWLAEWELPRVQYPADNHMLKLYWNDLNSLQTEQLTFPIDKVVLTLLKQNSI